jgi:hypothetical protein
MPNGHMPVQGPQFVFGEYLGNEPHVFMQIDAPTISDRNAGALLATVLECI